MDGLPEFYSFFVGGFWPFFTTDNSPSPISSKKKMGILDFTFFCLLRTSRQKVEAFAEKFRDPRIANMLKVRAKTLIEYKEVGKLHGPECPKAGTSLFSHPTEDGGKILETKRIFFWEVSSAPKHMGVSKNRGTHKSSILIGFSIINHPFGVPLFLETPILLKWLRTVFATGASAVFDDLRAVAFFGRQVISSWASDPWRYLKQLQLDCKTPDEFDAPFRGFQLLKRSRWRSARVCCSSWPFLFFLVLKGKGLGRKCLCAPVQCGGRPPESRLQVQSYKESCTFEVSLSPDTPHHKLSWELSSAC